MSFLLNSFFLEEKKQPENQPRSAKVGEGLRWVEGTAEMLCGLVVHSDLTMKTDGDRHICPSLVS